MAADRDFKSAVGCAKRRPFANPRTETGWKALHLKNRAVKATIYAAVAFYLSPVPAWAAAPDCRYDQPTPSAPIISRDLFIIFFDWNSAAITAESAAILDTVSQVYAPLAHCDIIIATHADRSGPAPYNLALSRRRANAIIAYLADRGIRSAFRIEAYGETRPLIDTPDNIREPQNRRAEILAVPPTQR